MIPVRRVTVAAAVVMACSSLSACGGHGSSSRGTVSPSYTQPGQRVIGQRVVIGNQCYIQSPDGSLTHVYVGNPVGGNPCG